MIDVRFATILQMMLSLALAQEEGVARLRSTQLAAGTGTNPSLVRRLLPLLAEAGLIKPTLGRDGGVALSRPASEISLREVYEATLGGQPLWHPRTDIPHQCVVSTNMEAFFASLSMEAQKAVLATLAARTLADALAEMRAMGSGQAPDPV